MTVASRIVGHGEEAPDQLLANPLNFRRHPGHQLDALRGSMGELGWVKSVIVNRRTGYVIDGHARVEEVIRQKLKSIPVEYVDLSPEEERLALAVLDPITEIAIRDQDALNALLADVQAQDPKLQEFLESLGKEPEVTILPDADLDAVPEPPAEPVTKPGDVITLGRHRLMCGDSIRIDQVERLMGGEQADMVWTDPPYNVAVGIEDIEEARARRRRVDGKGVANDEMSDEKFRQFLRDAFSSMCAATKPGGAIYVAHADSEGYNFRGALREAGWLYKQCLVWVKHSLVLGRQDYQWRHEPILYGWKDGGAHSWFSDRSQTTVLEFDKPAKSADHPTMKPVELVAYCVGNSSAPGHIVLDLFGGSGTTLMAAEKLGRSARLMEIDPRYCDVIVRRWEEATGQKAVRPASP